MEYCCHVWASCYLELLDKLQRQLHSTVAASFVTSLKPLAHHQNKASLTLIWVGFLGVQYVVNGGVKLLPLLSETR